MYLGRKVRQVLFPTSVICLIELTHEYGKSDTGVRVKIKA